MGIVQSVLDKDCGTYERRVERAVVLLVLFYGAKNVYGLGLGGLRKTVMNKLLAGGKLIPGVEGVVRGELDKEMEGIKKNVLGDGDKDTVLTIPEHGLPDETIIARAEKLIADMTGFAEGKKWGGIYYRNKELSHIQIEMWSRFSSTNLLFPMVFPGARQLEAELVSMTVSLVHGNVGVLTSGGTESILIAMLGYREQARKRGIAEPEILCGVTVHPAALKASFYFGMKLVRAPVDPATQRMSVALTKPFINKNTICIYASAPTFIHGVVDPIEELASLAVEHGIGVHVDNCLGGYLLSYLQKEGLYTKQWDFRVEGVTSMSVDVHKYGFASKGVSVAVFRDNEMRQSSYVPSSDGCEGLYITPTLQGSRSGGVVAAGWGTVVKLGDDGYRKAARRLHAVKEAYIREVEKFPMLKLLAYPDAAVVPIASNSSSLDIYLLASLMEKRGWNMFTGQHPPVMSVCVGEQQTPEVIEQWSDDISTCLEEITADPKIKIEGAAAVYGTAGSTPDELLHAVMCSYVDTTLTAKKAE
eukprot:TRINITY_DN1181_c9_g1_i1.p1 TRINITY_DN1181_c9_g1~~TRINITY_DN1181_c9_g1_i1.p1  ORF type:complete len:553 (+),score=123.64 TRINITY_DN1181_c9_g1_i1:71-1660(+)